MENTENRTALFKRNDSLESFLSEINLLLKRPNEELRADVEENHHKIFVLGALRSGTTLFTQWLASSGMVSYPSNMLSRFYGSPLIGARIQQLLTDPAYNFRNEILDFNSEIDFRSENGKTKGALAPNEFWYFWRRFLPFTDIDYMPDEELKNVADLSCMRDELNGLANIFQRPFALKAMILNQNIPVLDGLFNKALFVWIKRDPIYNMQSALLARQRQYGNMETWYSFKIKEYPELSRLDPLRSVAGQIFAINQSVEQALENLPEERKMVVQYEEFCEGPEIIFNKIKEKLAIQDNPTLGFNYHGETRFQNTNEWHLEEYTEADAVNAYREMSVLLSNKVV